MWEDFGEGHHWWILGHQTFSSGSFAVPWVASNPGWSSQRHPKSKFLLEAEMLRTQSQKPGQAGQMFAFPGWLPAMGSVGHR